MVIYHTSIVERSPITPAKGGHLSHKHSGEVTYHTSTGWSPITPAQWRDHLSHQHRMVTYHTSTVEKMTGGPPITPAVERSPITPAQGGHLSHQHRVVIYHTSTVERSPITPAQGGHLSHQHSSQNWLGFVGQNTNPLERVCPLLRIETNQKKKTQRMQPAKCTYGMALRDSYHPAN